MVLAASLLACALSVVVSARQQEPSISAELQALRTQLASGATEEDRAEAAFELAEADPDGSIEYLIQRLPQDPSVVVKVAIVNALSQIDSQRARTAIAEAAGTADPAVAVVARMRLGELSALEVERRMELMATADPSRSAALAQPAEALVTALRGGGFPEELRQPPAVFAVGSQPAEIRFVVIGDFGTGKKEQTQVADLIAKQDAKTPFLFGITVGDNFYNEGLCGLKNKRWMSEWHGQYDRLEVPFYASLGNHDWLGVDLLSGKYCSAPDEIRYTDEKTNPNWKMPRTHYTYTAGPAQFFVLDTSEEFSPQQPQRDWLARELKNSNRPWKIVYGHHPIYSGGRNHGSSDWLKKHNDILQSKETEADLYIAGHDHDLQHLKEKNLHYLGVGGGGKKIKHDVVCLPQSLFAHRGHGFASIRATDSELELELISSEGKPLHGCTITKKRLTDGTIQRTDTCKTTCVK